jgi:hypothetical protein
VAADFHSTGLDDLRLSFDVETNLYRVSQEALNNVHEHAAATRVGVILERRGAQVVLIIEDDGRGFEYDEAGAARFDKRPSSCRCRQSRSNIHTDVRVRVGACPDAECMKRSARCEEIRHVSPRESARCSATLVVALTARRTFARGRRTVCMRGEKLQAAQRHAAEFLHYNGTTLVRNSSAASSELAACRIERFV